MRDQSSEQLETAFALRLLEQRDSYRRDRFDSEVEGGVRVQIVPNLEEVTDAIKRREEVIVMVDLMREEDESEDDSDEADTAEDDD